jgi:probable F420-dependent oxidoreductase
MLLHALGRRCTVKIGLAGAGASEFSRPEIFGPLASRADEVGFATLWLPEHIVFFRQFGSQHPYSMEGERIPSRPDMLNPYVAMAYAAGVTSRIRLGTAVSIVPLYNPLLLAKLVSSVDFLSGGRVAFGVGCGWLEEEYDALGIPWERRAARLKEYVAAMREVWGAEEATFHGEFTDFERVRSFPKPVAAGHPPVIYGGNTDIALRRATEYCDGLFMWKLTPDQAAERIAKTRELLDQRGRAGDDFEFIVTVFPGMKPDVLDAYHQAGVDEVVLHWMHLQDAGAEDPVGVPDALGVLAEEWLQPASAFS